ncbi:hypothetical protein GCM10009007_03480 [Formosimonas limnophila]|uniref:Uncharacterized protein n=1 Tax=Formosimonas limnophila TaxID=1384487 RepID=A0A8J3G073_9BURK|nr:hypothetical protein [Formosimonas limnophila]GHA66315.1 hypothetical protein GCM10009007_03480 [Formosimonas limnophila]
MTAFNRYLSIRIPELGIEVGGAQRYQGRKVVRPLKITATCSLSAESTPNDAQVTIYNLSEQSAKKIFQNDKTAEIWAGYSPEGDEENIGLMFLGKIKNITSSVQGVDRVWVIDIGDGAQAYKGASVVDKSDKGDLEKSAKLAADAMKNQYGIETGTIKLGKKITTGKTITYNGDYSRDVLDDVCLSTDSKWNITHGILNVTPKNEVVKDTGLVLTPQTGLIGYPKITDDGVEIETIVIPNVRPDMAITVQARYGSGTYQINQIDMQLSNSDGDHKFTMRYKNMDDKKTISPTQTGRQSNVNC